MEVKIKKAFNSIHANNELKEKTLSYLKTTIENLTVEQKETLFDK